MRATVTTPNGERHESITGPELDYYLGEAEHVDGYVIDEEPDEAASFPQVWQGGVRVDQPAEQVAEGTGEPNTGIEVAQGETGEIGDDEDHPRPSPTPSA